MTLRATRILWTIAVVICVAVIARYAWYWALVRPRATNVDRVVFIGACAGLCGLLVASRALRNAIVQTLRRSQGQCVHCGYDLRATPDRCPECGTLVERAK
jgi:type VI protein secretion system component VasK